MSGISTLGQILDQIERIKDQQTLFSSLSTQLASGKKTQKFEGLGTGLLTSKRARADFKSLDTYTNNITNADRRINLMLRAIEEFKAQAKHFSNALIGFSQEGTHTEGENVYWDDPTTPDVIENIPVGVDSENTDVSFRTLQSLAGNLFDLFVDLVNIQEGDRYLLGGAETLTKPLDITGTLDAAISTLITDWKGGTLTTTDFIADLKDRTTTGGNTNALTDSIIGYNAPLSNNTVKDIFIRVDDIIKIEYTALANDQAFRDIIIAVSYLKNETLPPLADEVEIDSVTGLPVVLTNGAPGTDTDEMKDNFYRIFNELGTMVNRAIDDIDQQRFKLESVRARIDGFKENHENEQNVLLSTIANIEDVDINEVAVKITTLQIQLEASFMVTAKVHELSLVNFI
ncbi:MAG: hypothetical protein KAJ86_00910 [Alphaproteobacteria bacterium]|nr:hypothetical protein [Alphaproteobacteria bacterium]